MSRFGAKWGGSDPLTKELGVFSCFKLVVTGHEASRNNLGKALGPRHNFLPATAVWGAISVSFEDTI